MATAYTEFYLELYKLTLRVTTQPEAWDQMVEGLDRDEENPVEDQVFGRTFGAPNGTGITVAVFIADCTDDPDDLVLQVAHEAVHAAGFLYEIIGAEQNGLDEPYAYLVGWLTRKIMSVVHSNGETETQDA